jgi:glycosyltransferase involved in cell wall biosynthesis
MHVTLLVANYNNGPYLIECFESIIGQTYKNWNAIILDDCSTDNSVEIIQGFIKDDQRFQLIAESENRGVGYAKKKLVDCATGEIAAFLDPDDIIVPGALQSIVEQLSNNPALVAVYTGYCICDSRLENCAQVRNYPFGIRVKNSFWQTGIGSIHPLFGFRREAYRLTEGIDPAYRIGEDLDLYLKLEELGDFLRLEEIGYKVRRHDKSLTAEAKATQSLPWIMRVLYSTGKRRVKKNIFTYHQYSILILEKFIYYLQDCKAKGDSGSFYALRKEFFTSTFNKRMFWKPVFYKYMVSSMKHILWW